MKKDYIKYFLALLLFGSNGIVASHISLTSYQIVFLRTMIGSLLLLAIYLFSKEEKNIIKNKRDIIYIALSGIAMGTSWIFLYEAYSEIGVSIASLCYYCGPVIVMILSPILFKEKLTWTKVTGFIVVLIGIVLVNQNVFNESSNKFGIFCGLMSAVMYSIMVMANKKSKNIIGLENSTIQLIISFLTVAVFTMCKTGIFFQVKGIEWIWIIILGLLNTGIGCYFYFSSIGNLPIQTVAVCGYLEPLSAVILSVILLDESMVILQIMGAFLIIGGALFGECYKSKK